MTPKRIQKIRNRESYLTSGEVDWLLDRADECERQEHVAANQRAELRTVKNRALTLEDERDALRARLDEAEITIAKRTFAFEQARKSRTRNRNMYLAAKARLDDLTRWRDCVEEPPTEPNLIVLSPPEKGRRRCAARYYPVEQVYVFQGSDGFTRKEVIGWTWHPIATEGDGG